MASRRGTATGRAEGAAAGQSFTLKIDHNAVQRLLNSPEGPVAKDLLKKSLMIQRRAKQKAPVISGRLRASIAYRLGKDGRGIYAQIGSNVAYAARIELGFMDTDSLGRTYHQPANSYLRSSLAEVIPGGIRR